ncbi:cation transporter [Hydrogenoanaerobacterium saccharovorans]|uniref:Cation transporter n=1 Tax=Hydrogenoanaerobacterium saccharovorans TaxID=474960 RepID=A0ABS2GN05_9FIRM|nr:cation diffusion facilitator family transporter [Hydrogenoanaerobacterium saccharovorans]MBM6922949.1 cation transporter [Hydrogenoanaerobacterium saccharovorans]
MTEFLLSRFVKGYPEVNDPQVRARCGNLAGLVGICCNLLLSAGKFLAGLLTGSVAISADAVNNLSDASSSIITLLGFRLAARPADDEHPYGHGRTEYLSGLAVSVMILLIGAELAKTSIQKILSPEPITTGMVSILILAASILVKFWMAAFNRHVGRLIRSATLEATAADSRNDVISTGAVLIATLLQMQFGWNLDGYMGLAVAAFILWSGWGLVKDSIAPLLGQTPDPELVRHIADVTLSYPGVLGIHDMIVHDYGPGRQFASLHAEMAAGADVLESHDTIDRIEKYFLEQEGLHVVIHYDPIVTDDSETGEAREFFAAEAKKLDPRLSIHDLRMVPGTTHTNVIFDLVLPRELDSRTSELKHALQEAAQRKNPLWLCVITAENSFTGTFASEKAKEAETSASEQ